jgi:protease II
MPIQGMSELDLEGEFVPNYYDDRLYVTTTWKGPNRRIFSLGLNRPEQAKWRALIHEQKDHIETAVVLGGKLFFDYSHSAAP